MRKYSWPVWPPRLKTIDGLRHSLGRRDLPGSRRTSNTGSWADNEQKTIACNESRGRGTFRI